MNQKYIDLNSVVTSHEKTLRRALGESITLKVELAPKPVNVFLDEGMVGQVLNSLAENARNKMPGGGTLTVQTEFIEVDDTHARVQPGARRGTFVRLSVSDNGSGFNTEGLRKLFLQTSTSTEPNAGLGLALISGMIKRRHGWIEATSQNGGGTTILIYVPMADQTSYAPWIAETILLVDDEPAIRRMVKTVLERASYNVIEADTGVQALATWDKNKSQVNLLLTDMVMPDGVNGRELARRLKDSKPSLNVIYTSGYDLESEAKSDMSEGVARFLHKPYDMRKLLQVVHEMLTPPTVTSTSAMAA